MSSRSANEILLEQECDRLKAEIDRHVRIYELALQETKAELDAARKWIEADSVRIGELLQDRERLASLVSLISPFVRVANEYKASIPDGEWLRVSACFSQGDFQLGDLRRIQAAVAAATKGGANG